MIQVNNLYCLKTKNKKTNVNRSVMLSLGNKCSKVALAIGQITGSLSIIESFRYKKNNFQNYNSVQWETMDFNDTKL